MYSIFKDYTFSAAHFIPGHTGGCERLHGHNYRIRVWLQAETLDKLGMVLDFAHLKAAMAKVFDPFDHRTLNDIPPFDQVSPTAEAFAAYAHGAIAKLLEDERVSVSKVEVWENPTSCAIYSP